MAEDIAFWELGVGAPLRVELDIFALAQLATARLRAGRAPVGLLFGEWTAPCAYVRSAAVLGAVEDVRALDEAGRLEPLVRHLAATRGSPLGWFAFDEQGFEHMHQRLARFRGSAFVFLCATWRGGRPELRALAPAPNRRFRHLFALFLHVPLTVVARELPHPAVWAMLVGTPPVPASAEDEIPPLERHSALLAHLERLEAGLDSAERLIERAAELGASFAS